MDPARAQRILRQHLLTDRLLGVSSVPRNPTAEVSLNPPEPASPPQNASPQTPPVPPRRAEPAPPSSPPLSPPAQRIPEPDSREEKIRLLHEMDVNEVQGCTHCDLCQSRTRTVFGEGDPDAAIMFIGEGPGQNEDLQGRPFVGRAGELLTKMIEAGMQLKREDVYITNVVKCRPPNNRTPQKPEVDACWGYLRRQIAWIRPRAIVTLGGPATKLMLQTDTGITRLRGTWARYDGIDPPIPVMPTFHPAYLLRSYTKENRMKVWADLKAVLAEAGEA